MPIPGDINGDGRVNFADITAAQAAVAAGRLPFAAISGVLANFGAGCEPPPVYALPLTPFAVPRGRLWAGIIFAVGGIASVTCPTADVVTDRPGDPYAAVFRLVPRTGEPGSHVVTAHGVYGGGLVFRVDLNAPQVTLVHSGAASDGKKPLWTKSHKLPDRAEHVVMMGWRFDATDPNGSIKMDPAKYSTKATRLVQFNGCEFIGDGGDMPIVEANAWGGGVWLEDTSIFKLQSPPDNAQAYYRCNITETTSEGLHLCHAACGVKIKDLDKLPNSPLHPDGWQASFKFNPGAVAMVDCEMENCNSQLIFARCNAIDGVCIQRVKATCKPVPAGQNGYSSKFRGVAMKDLLLRDVYVGGQRFTFDNDTRDGIKYQISSLRSDVMNVRSSLGPDAVAFDPNSGIVPARFFA